MKKIGTILQYIVLAFLVLTLAARFFGVITYAVESDSMAPHMYKFSLVYVKILDADEQQNLDRFDVVVFNEKIKPVIHRIDVIDADGYITTKGDNNESDDKNKLRKSEIYAKELFHIPLIGMFILSYIPILVVVGIVLIIFFIKAIRKELKKGA